MNQDPTKINHDPNNDPSLWDKVKQRAKKPVVLLLAGAAFGLTACGNNSEATPEQKPATTATQSGETEPTTPSLTEPIPSETETEQTNGEWEMDLEIDPSLPLEYQAILATRYNPETSWEDYIDTFAIPNTEDLTQEQLATMMTTTWRDFQMTNFQTGLQPVHISDSGLTQVDNRPSDAEEIEATLIDRNRQILEVLLSNETLLFSNEPMSPAKKELAINLLAPEGYTPNTLFSITENMSLGIWNPDEPDGGDGIENPYKFMYSMNDISIHPSTDLSSGTATVLYTEHRADNFQDALEEISTYDPTLAGNVSNENLDSRYEQFMSAHLDSDGIWRFSAINDQEKLEPSSDASD